MGGMHGFGAVDHRPDEALFPEAWQGRVCALAGYAMAAGLANLDAFRHAIERMPPDRYLADGYYGRWLYALETLARERLGGDNLPERPEHLGSVAREVDREAGFAVGDAVRTWNRHPEGHTRLPGYACGRRGVIAEVHPAFRARLLEDGMPAIRELGFGDNTDAHVARLVVKENTESVHNLIVCTLCSCYPWAVLGLPPAWYKSPAYRARAVREPRRLLVELGLELPPEVEVRVWDSSAEVRYMVLPQRPEGTIGLGAEELASLVTRDSMIGVERL